MASTTPDQSLISQNPARKSRLQEWIYLDLTIVGTAIPLYLFDRYVIEHGLSTQHILANAFANSVATAVSADVIVSSLVFWVLAAQEMSRRKTGWGKLPIFMLMNLLIGLSSALPAFLWWRERQRPI